MLIGWVGGISKPLLIWKSLLRFCGMKRVLVIPRSLIPDAQPDEKKAYKWKSMHQHTKHLEGRRKMRKTPNSLKPAKVPRALKSASLNPQICPEAVCRWGASGKSSTSPNALQIYPHTLLPRLSLIRSQLRGVMWVHGDKDTNMNT